MGFLNNLFNRTGGGLGSDDFTGQVSDPGVKWLFDHLHSVRVEVLCFLEPTYEVFPEQQFFIPNVLAEFRDPMVGIIHGQGGGHAFIRVAVLRSIASSSTDQILDYQALVDAFRERGFIVKRIQYLRVARK